MKLHDKKGCNNNRPYYKNRKIYCFEICSIKRVFRHSNKFYKEVELVANEITNNYCDSIAIEADISKEYECINMIERTIKHFGRIEVLVNNADIQRDIPRKNKHRRMVQNS